MISSEKEAPQHVLWALEPVLCSLIVQKCEGRARGEIAGAEAVLRCGAVNQVLIRLSRRLFSYQIFMRVKDNRRWNFCLPQPSASPELEHR